MTLLCISNSVFGIRLEFIPPGTDPINKNLVSNLKSGLVRTLFAIGSVTFIRPLDKALVQGGI